MAGWIPRVISSPSFSVRAASIMRKVVKPPIHYRAETLLVEHVKQGYRLKAWRSLSLLVRGAPDAFVFVYERVQLPKKDSNHITTTVRSPPLSRRTPKFIADLYVLRWLLQRKFSHHPIPLLFFCTSSMEMQRVLFTGCCVRIYFARPARGLSETESDWYRPRKWRLDLRIY
jgi:hypothetical protein